VVLDGWQAPDLTHLAYYAKNIYHGTNHLGTKEIAAISTLPSLKNLELHNWTNWDDLAPLEELRCSDRGLLFRLELPGSLKPF